MIDRETLEKQARACVPEHLFYQFEDSLDTLSDLELQDIIDRFA
jgi:hypothetical protein